jgi:hypothetical protein
MKKISFVKKKLNALLLFGMVFLFSLTVSIANYMKS